VDDAAVQEQERRNAKSVTIATGLLLGAATLVLGLLVLWISDKLLGLPRAVSSSFTLAFETTSVVVLVAYVARNRTL
jgi:hypothetical protein